MKGSKGIMLKKISFLIFDILLNNAELWKALSPWFREALLDAPKAP